MRKILLVWLCLICSSTSYATSIGEIRIAAGVAGGTYYPVALQLCSFISKYSPITKCEVVTTSGSINNLNLLATDKVDFAFAQSDVVRDASKGLGIFANQRPYNDLRLVMNLFPEVFSMIAKDEKGIVNFSDAAGKKVGINLKGSGAKSGLVNLFRYFKFDKEPQIIHVSDSQMSARLCDNEVDAVVLFTGHPSGVASQITSTCDVEFVSIDPLKLDNLVAEIPVYEKYSIPARSYIGISRNASTFATRALLVTNVDTPSAKVKLFRDTISKYFEEFQKLYPALGSLKKEQVFREGPITRYPE